MGGLWHTPRASPPQMGGLRGGAAAGADTLGSGGMSSSQQSPENNYDPAGSTQMFRAFVDEQPQAAVEVQRAQARPRVGLIVGIVVAVVVIVGVVVLAMK